MPISLSGSLLITGSLTASGTLTAQTLVVQTVTSSIVYSSGSNIFGNSQSNIQQMTGSLRVTGSGNHYILGGSVGIGTTSPSTLFQTNQAGSTGYFYSGQQNGTEIAYWYYNASAIEFSSKSATRGLALMTNDTTRLFISASGNVGIGTTTPFSQLSLPSGNGWNGGLAWNYTTNNSASKRWWINTDQIAYGDFRIATEITQGGGTISSAGTLYERFYISAAGSVSIGSTSTPYNFNVYGASGADGWGAFFGGAGTTKGGIYLGNAGNQYGSLHFDNATNNVVLKQAYASGTVNVIANTGGVTLANGGTSWAAISSDVRKKKNFETVPGLDAVLQVEPVKYHFLTDDDTSTKRLGFNAQNIKTLIPEMVLETGEFAEDGSPYLTVTPDYILPVLVKAIQELKATNDDLQAQINELKER